MKIRLALYTALLTMVMMAPVFSCAPEMDTPDYSSKYLIVETSSHDTFVALLDNLLPAPPPQEDYWSERQIPWLQNSAVLSKFLASKVKNYPFTNPDDVVKTYGYTIGEIGKSLEDFDPSNWKHVDDFAGPLMKALPQPQYQAVVEQLWVARMESFDSGSCRMPENVDDRLQKITQPAVAVAFRDYVLAAFHFRCNENAFGTSKTPINLNAFAKLSKSAVAWVAETSTYMQARALLHASEQKWNGWRPPSATNIDQDKLNAAEAAFKAYIREYPNGLYTKSSIGLERFILNLRGDQAGLNKALLAGIPKLEDQLLAKKATYDDGNNQLLEFARYYKGTVDVASAPAIATAYEVITSKPEALKSVKATDVEANIDLKRFPALRSVIVATLLYKTKQYPALSKTATDGLDQKSALDYETLRLIALGKMNAGDATGAASMFRELLTQYPDDYHLRMALAKTYAMRGNLLAAFSDPTVMGKPDSLDGVRADLISALSPSKLLELAKLEHAAAQGKDPKALPQIYDSVKRALYFGYIVGGHYQAFNDTYAELGDLYHGALFSEVTTAMRMLAKDPNDPKGALNAGYFLDTQGGQGIEYSVGTSDALQKWFGIAPTTDATPDDSASRMNAYKFYDITAKHYANSSVHSEDEAKALHYLIMCFKPHEFGSSCFSGSIPTDAEPKVWFNRLHKKYPHDRWAIETPYFY